MIVKAPLMEERMLDTMVVTAPVFVEEEAEEDPEPLPQELPRYNPSSTRFMDIIHTDLDISFDWENEAVLGKADITMSPVFYPQEAVTLDAKGFEFNSISLEGKSLDYDYDGQQVTISLDQIYQRNDSLTISINYVAYPSESDSGGSAAISSDKGLFFINPRGEDPEKPMQIWTQGETENNSRWFPTFDKPNERTTQEINITVQDRFVTLSNGKMISSVTNGDGTRTDTWRQDQPHAPYLFMLAVGEYAVVKENWKDIELLYYVEEDYRPFARDIFNHTPEMLTYFSNLLDYPYPWDKYAQVICRDYVSGAMENTTAVVFGDFVQKTSRELMDNDNDYIVAHEMFHHWFGDLVTTESWANLTLQEGFANYSEYLWFEHKYGKDRADYHRMSEMEGYLLTAQNQGTHPLIHYEYMEKESMFDAHSYNKGGLVLHMLRNLVGDDAFFSSLNKYLKDNAFSAVEVDELRMAFEDITGTDLQWFFNQWYLSPGHPSLEIDYSYDSLSRAQIISVRQTQMPEDHLPIFRLEVDIAVYDQEGHLTYYPATLDKRNQEFIIEDIDQPAVVAFDGKNTQLAEINEDRSIEENMALLQFSPHYQDKWFAARGLKRKKEFSELTDLLLSQNYYTLREMGLEAINFRKNPEKISLVKSLITKDPHSQVRTAALKKLTTYDYSEAKTVVIEVLNGNDAYPVIAAALSAMMKNEPLEAISYANKYQDVDNMAIVNTLADIYARTGDAQYLPFFEDRLSSVSLFSMFNFYNKYFDLLNDQSNEMKLAAVDKLAIVSLSKSNMFRKFVATSTINKIEDSFTQGEDEVELIKIRKVLDKILEEETNDQLIMRYRSF